MQTLPNPDLFVFMYVRKEAVLSSQIEGTQSSLQDLLAAEAKLLELELPKDVDEVVNYVEAMNHGLSRLRKLPVSVRLIREIHSKLMEGVRGGKLDPCSARRASSTGWGFEELFHDRTVDRFHPLFNVRGFRKMGPRLRGDDIPRYSAEPEPSVKHR